ncbi:MAG: hypothetical protein N3A65_09690, partial [candidate division WOR-3 bacterium]|nr:hypothetical protein [candidate division WOR-3 bacterium]
MGSVKKLILLLFVLLVAEVMAETPLYGRFAITQGSPKVNEEFTLTLTIKALVDFPEMLVLFDIPDSINVTSGSLSQQLNLVSNDSLDLPLSLSIPQSGPYKIKAYIIATPTDTLHPGQLFVKEFYIVTNTETAIYSENPTEGVYYNLSPDQIIGEIPPELPEPLTGYTLSGQVKYRNKLTNELDPLPDIFIKVIDRTTGQVVGTTHTNANGNYSFALNPGQYTLIIFAQNYAGEVHPCWKAVARWYGDMDMNCSPDVYRIATLQVNLYTNLTVNYDAEGDKADWARILWRIRREKSWMYTHTSPHHTLDYVEVSYPAVVTILINRPWPLSDTTIYFAMPQTPFYVYFGKLEAVRVKYGDIPSWGVEVSYRNPHQIVIEKYHDIWGTTGAIGGLSHEWSHGLMVATLGGKVPYNWGHAIHTLDTVLTRGHAFSEGFAEFNAPAMWVEEMEGNVYPSTKTLERFYANDNWTKPFYRGSSGIGYSNTNGSFVEGSVMQFFWDLFDDINTNDHEPNFDDDGVYAGINKIINTLASLGGIMTAETSVWDTLQEEGHADFIAFKSKKAHFPGPNYDFIGKFKDRWQALNYGNITELFNVDIHPFNYLSPYPVPAPTNLSLSIDHLQKKVTLSWQNNAANQGAFYVARNLNNSGYITAYAKISNPDWPWRFSEYIQEGNSYKYKVRAMTCDTSGYSNEVTIPWYVAAPTLQPVVDMPPNQARVSWQNNSNLTITSYTLSRWNEVTNTWKDDYKTNLTTTSFDDTVTFLHKYKYRVKAKESDGHWSDWSNVREFSCGMLAQSSYPKMSAFNNGAKVAKYGNNVYVAYRSGNSIACLISTDNG